MAKKTVKETIHAKGIDIGIYTSDFQNEYISLTDIAKYRNEDDPRFVIQNWMRNRNTVESQKGTFPDACIVTCYAFKGEK